MRNRITLRGVFITHSALMSPPPLTKQFEAHKGSTYSIIKKITGTLLTDFTNSQFATTSKQKEPKPVSKLILS